MNLNVLMALGRSDLFLRLEIMKKILIVISIAVTWQWGISAMIYGLIVLSVLCFYLNSYYTGILIGYTLSASRLGTCCPICVMAVLMGVSVYAAGHAADASDWQMLLLIEMTVGIGGVCFLVPGFPAGGVHGDMGDGMEEGYMAT